MQDLTPNLPPIGTLVQTVNDSPFEIVGPNDTANFSSRDGLSLALGGTDSDQDFAPAIHTDTFGDVYVDELGVTLVSQKSPDFFNSVDLPNDLSFLNDTDLKSSLFEIRFSGQNLPSDFDLTGSISTVNKGGTNPPPTTAVPKPGTFAMMGLGLALLGFGVRKHKKG